MPELPEVETVRAGLAPFMLGFEVVELEQRRANLRFPFPEDFAPRVQGCTIERFERRAKYLLAFLSSGEVLVMHLGMSGRFTIHEDIGAEHSKPKGNPGKFVFNPVHYERHDHIILRMSSGAEIVYNDTRRFGFMLLLAADTYQDHDLFRTMGVEPLGNSFNSAYLAARASGKATSLKAFLLDQKHIAGLGNIYVCEALHMAGLSPAAPASSLATKTGKPKKSADLLSHSIVTVLRAAIKAGGSTLQDHRQANGDLGYFQHQFAVYGRAGEKCKNKRSNAPCTGTIERIVQNGRSTFFCPRCQP